MRFLLTSLFAASLAWGACTTDARGVCVTGLTAIQDNLLGPLIPSGSSPWIYADLIEKDVIDYMEPLGIAEAPALPGSSLAGTFSWTAANNVLATTANQTAAVSPGDYLALAWTTVDGSGTGRAICNVGSVTSTTVTCSSNIFAPTSSGVTGYKMSSTAGPSTFTFLGWAPQNGSGVSVTWNYYDVAIGFYRYYYRNLTSTYQTYARAYADTQWQWVIDHGYDIVVPRVASMVSQFFRVTEGHTERLPGLYNYISAIQSQYGDTTSCFAAAATCDNRESGYTLWDVALGAKVETDSTRHAQYCTWLVADVAPWNSNQYADGSWGENDFGINSSYPAAPRNYTDSPLHFQGSPWRLSINIKALEAAYESLNDTTSQGCNNPTLAATTLTTITNAVTWQRNYGRDTTNRGVWYEVGSASCDQPGCGAVALGTGTVDATSGSPNIVGHSTTWNTDGDCDGTHFIGIGSNSDTPRGVYKISSCSDNTHAVLTVNFGKFGESSVTGKIISFAPSASTSCGASLSTYCFLGAGNGDRNLTRTNCGATAWLYAQTLNATYKTWSDECVAATLGGPTAGPTTSTHLGSTDLPCSGPACDGYIGDVGNFIAVCGSAPCMIGNTPYIHLGKDWGEAFGAPGIDNALAWRLYGGGSAINAIKVSGVSLQ